MRTKHASSQTEKKNEITKTKYRKIENQICIESSGSRDKK